MWYSDVHGYLDCIFSNEFGEVISLYPYMGKGSYVGECGVLLSAEEFAERAKYYLQDKNKIVPHLNKLFDKWREDYRKELESKRPEKMLMQRQRLKNSLMIC